MKIRSGQPLRSQKETSRASQTSADGQFQILLDNQMLDAADPQHTVNSEHDAPTAQHQQLLNDATRLLDEAIEQIEHENAPREQTVESLQQLRKKIADMGLPENKLSAANTILAVETERLKSW